MMGALLPRYLVHQLQRKRLVCGRLGGGALDARAINLAPGRLEQIKKDLLSDDHSSFDCHKSVYRKNSTEHKPKDQRKMCAGAAKFLMEQGRPTISMRLAFALGVVKPDQWQLQTKNSVDSNV